MTATSLLIETLESFSDSEPSEVVIVFRAEGQQTTVTSNCHASTAIGLCEFGKAVCLDQMRGKLDT